ncbi:MAG: hypothetical protein QNJ30_08620 [Kiloniellales bacterium]|nr:hypothetical protein [Kiloniellales bacterium]
MELTEKALGRIAAAAAVLVFVSACGVPTTYKWNREQWSRGKLGYAAAQGAMLTDIRGNPFTGPKAELDKAVTETMYGAHFGPLVRFVTQAEAPQGLKSPYRVVMLFNPEETTRSKELCTGDPAPGAPTPGQVKIAAAVCSQDLLETAIWGRVAEVSGPDDAGFKALIRQMTMQLFPHQNPDDRSAQGPAGYGSPPVEVSVFDDPASGWRAAAASAQ